MRSVIGWRSLCHFLNQSGNKPTPIVPRSHAFSRALRRLYVFPSDFDWFIVLFTSVLFDDGNYVDFEFTILNRLYSKAFDTIVYAILSDKLEHVVG